MTQLFPPVINTVARVSVLGAVFLLGGALWLTTVLAASPLVSRVGITRTQPIAYSHKTHVGGLGMDCRYCHASVEESAVAGLPPTRTCMGCHSEILADSPFLGLVRSSYEEDVSIPWTRVHDLPDFVRFDHSIHVKKGVGCSSCHGHVDRMPRIAQGATLQMVWCLSCHRNPAANLRAEDEIFDPAWVPPPDQMERGRKLAARNAIETDLLSDCSICHQ